jgi:hypothetical protein
MRGSFIMDSSDIMMVWLVGSVTDSIILHVKWNKLIRKVYQWWQPNQSIERNQSMQRKINQSSLFIMLSDNRYIIKEILYYG